MEITPEKLQQLRIKRTSTLLGTWDFIQSAKPVYKGFKISSPLVTDVIEHYVSDYKIIKERYKIEDNIQLHKIAGLMGSAILRYRPVIPLFDSYSSQEEVFANEYLAVIHGIALCAQHADKADQLAVIKEPWFDGWMADLMFLLHCRNYTAEGLIFIFETLSCLKFPYNLAATDS